MENSSARSYDRYAALLNKACSSVLFLIIALLTTALCVGNIITLFNVIPSGNFLSILFPLLSSLFISLTTIGLWALFINAKKNSIGSGSFGLVRCYPKYDQIIKTIIFIILILATTAIIIGLFTLKSKIDNAVNDNGDYIEEIKNEIRDYLDKADIPEEHWDDIDKVIDKIEYLTTGLIIITVACVFIIIFLIFELIRCATLVKFLLSAGNMFKTGHMVAPPSMFFCVLNYIFATINIVTVLSRTNLMGFDWQMFVTGIVLALIGVIFMINRKPVKDIYNAWKVEISMISPESSIPKNTFVPDANSYVNPQQFVPEIPVQQPIQDVKPAEEQTGFEQNSNENSTAE